MNNITMGVSDAVMDDIDYLKAVTGAKNKATAVSYGVGFSATLSRMVNKAKGQIILREPNGAETVLTFEGIC